MGAFLKYYISFLNLLLLNSNVVSHVQSSEGILSLVNPRVKRQAGYVYDKPSISFDLPTRPTTASTQAPTVDRPREQQMYYAYPAPAGGNTVNIGYSSSTATSTASAAAGDGAATGGTAGGGYNYQTQVTATTGSQGSAGSGASGYKYNAPTSTPATPVSVPETVSTNAPKYLPPLSNGGSSGTNGGVSVNIPTTGGPVTTGRTTIPTSTSAVPIPDVNYLPPLSTPNPAPRPIPVDPALPSNYLPPNIETPNSPGQTSLPTPASTYLPPVF